MVTLMKTLLAVLTLWPAIVNPEAPGGAVMVNAALAGDPATPDVDAVARGIFESTNRFREQEHRGALARREQLDEAAREFARFLAESEKFSHEADGSNPEERATKHGYEPCIVAENIAYEFSTTGFQTAELAQRFMESWKKSPGHRKNLLDPDLLEIGVGVAASKQSGKFYAVQVFGRPRSAAIEFSVANQSAAEIAYQLDDQKLTLPPGVIRTHQQCRKAALSFSLDAAQGQPESFEPASGDRFVVTSASGKLQVKREPAERPSPAGATRQPRSSSPSSNSSSRWWASAVRLRTSRRFAR